MCQAVLSAYFVSWSAQAAIAKYHRLGDSMEMYSAEFCRLEVQDQDPTRVISTENSLLVC